MVVLDEVQLCLRIRSQIELKHLELSGPRDAKMEAPGLRNDSSGHQQITRIRFVDTISVAILSAPSPFVSFIKLAGQNN